jgi:deoxycytidylate deaminase
MIDLSHLDHERFMAGALEQAKRALEAGDVPIEAVIVLDNEIIAGGVTGDVPVVASLNMPRSMRSERLRWCMRGTMTVLSTQLLSPVSCVSEPSP